MATEETKPVERDISMGLTERRIRGRIQAHGGLAGIGDILANFRQASADAALERAAELMRTRADDLGKQGYDEFHKAADAIRALKGRE